MHPTKRSARRFGRPTATQPVRKAVLVLEEQLPAVCELRQTDLPGGHALRIERPVHLAEEGARRRRLAHAQRVSTLGQALRRARLLQAEGRRPGDRGTVRSPGRRFVTPRALAPGQREAEAQQPGRRQQRPPGDHGTKSFGWRESDARKTRTLARAGSSSAR